MVKKFSGFNWIQIQLVVGFSVLVLGSCGSGAKTKQESDIGLRINCGGPALKNWVSDEEFAQGTGQTMSLGKGTDFSHVEGMELPQVYRTARRHDHRYEIPLPNGRYRVRLHFAETQTNAKRAMSYHMNGVQVIENLDLENIAGGTKRALCLEVIVEVKGGNPLAIDAKAGKGTDVFQTGIEILRAPPSEAITTLPIDLEKRRVPRPSIPENYWKEIRQLTGQPTKIVWLEGERWITSPRERHKLRLMGIDTEKEIGPRDLVGQELAFAKPLITPDGQGVIVSDRDTKRIYHLDWETGKLEDLAEGWASDVWLDQQTGRVWVYYRSGAGSQDCPICRFPLDDPSGHEIVWEKTETGHVTAPWFQLSADGKYFVEAFPWPDCGWGNLRTKTWEMSTSGCWPGISPDNSYRKFVLLREHREIRIFDGGDVKGDAEGHIVDVSNIPGQKGEKIYHPQWSNHSRFLSLTSPQRSNRNELYLGRFDSEWKSIEKWVRITYNNQAESNSDVWIKPSNNPLNGKGGRI